MLWPWLTHWIAASLLSSVGAQYSSDQCNWRGSGLSHESHQQDVEQVYLRCSQGSLEWLYPTGALVVNLRPNTEPPPGGGPSPGPQACIKARADSQGARVYVERAGQLRLLLGEGQQGARVQCFSLAEGALFVEAVSRRDVGRETLAFQYELVTSPSVWTPSHPYLGADPASCKHCSDEEVLMAVCTSDIVGRGRIRGEKSSLSPGADYHSVSMELTRLFRQKGGMFARGGARGRGLGITLNAPLPCGVGAERKGEELLVTGAIHFGEAWLGCTRRYRDFLKLYRAAQETGSNPCHMETD
ncbi:meteorin-like protein [Osmerus eperlanus]|uniref:meteorin-like protein n=1 Tax=Osmerus eperlanus TaxID=29151 RepID=UPI002E0EAE20